MNSSPTHQYENISDRRLRRSLIFPFLAEIAMPILVIVLVTLSWILVIGYRNTLINTVIASYQETQLEVVRSVARSIHPFVESRLADGWDINSIEQEILKRFVAPIHLLENGDAWIYAPDHVVFDLSSDFPDTYRGKSMSQIFAQQKQYGASHYEQMSADVEQAHEGVGWYIWLPDKGKEIAAWSPVIFGPHKWTIGLSTPLNEILQASGAQSYTSLILMVMAIATLLGTGLAAISFWGSKRQRQLVRTIETRNRELQRLVTDLKIEVGLRTETENAAKQVSSQLNALIEAIPDVIYFKDIDGKHLIVNRAYENLIERSKADILGKRDDELLPADLARYCIEGDRYVIQNNKETRSEESMMASNGRTIFFDTYKAPLMDESGSILGLVGISRDITELKNAEKERERLGQQLLQAQKMEALGTLAGGVAHDLNNILSGLVSYPELLISDLPPDSPLRGPLKTIQLSGERAANIVQDLLTMARRGASEKCPININDIITEYLNSPSHRKMAMDRGNVHMDHQPSPDLMNISGSPSDLSKIIMNLLINAYEASTSQGKILIRTSNEYIDAHKTGMNDIPEGEYVHLRVQDNGIGIDSEHLPRIFEPFYSNKKLGSSGSGLGLAVVWGTVKDHNGIIDVKSSKDQGTTFDIYFPVCRQQMETMAPETPLSDLKGQGERILVVDDVPLQREIALAMLEKLGYTAMAVESGEAAVEYLEKNSADLIVLDMIMGDGMDGLDTYRCIIQLSPGQKAVIASGYSETERVRETQRLGAGAYVKKPFSIHALGLAIHRELQTKNQ